MAIRSSGLPCPGKPTARASRPGRADAHACVVLVLALTVGLFGIRWGLSYEVAPTTLVVDSVGTVVLAVTTALVFRRRRGA